MMLPQLRCGPAVLLALLSTAALVAQNPPGATATIGPPTVTFTFDWASLQPNHYAISVDSNGHAEYESRASEQGQGSEPYAVEFTVSPPVREKIFALARELNYFDGDFDFRKHKVAASGEKTLAYSDSAKHYETRFNWSENPSIQQLTAIFQGISTTLESGVRLEQLRRFEPLGLNEELKGLERQAAEHNATELRLIVPTLQKIANDTTVMNIARTRARHLLQMAGAAE